VNNFNFIKEHVIMRIFNKSNVKKFNVKKSNKVYDKYIRRFRGCASAFPFDLTFVEIDSGKYVRSKSVSISNSIPIDIRMITGLMDATSSDDGGFAWAIYPYDNNIYIICDTVTAEKMFDCLAEIHANNLVRLKTIYHQLHEFKKALKGFNLV